MQPQKTGPCRQPGKSVTPAVYGPIFAGNQQLLEYQRKQPASDLQGGFVKDRQRILVVDDHLDGANALVRLLRHSGCEAFAVGSAQEALSLLEEQKPDALILDVMMPGMDGPTLLQIIRSNPRLRDLPVVMYSSDSNYERVDEARRLGAQDYIVKGRFGWQDFHSRIESLVS
jgi:PleD family two-component response regulator